MFNLFDIQGNSMSEKVILAYSGGLDTSVILHWLINTKKYDVVCFVADVGQQEDFAAIKAKAFKTGACSVHTQNLQQELVDSYFFPALQANSIYEGSYLLGTSLARPLIAKKQVECALKENTYLLSHGATGKGNDQVRFELTYAYLMPKSVAISPWKDKDFLSQFKGRSDLINYAQKYNIPITSSLEKPYSIDENLLHSSYESGILENPALAPEQSMFKKTQSPFDAGNEPANLTIAFENGIPTKATNLNDGTIKTNSLDLVMYLNQLGGMHGIGRIDIVENRFVGIKSRGVYEAPACTILLKAHQDLESITVDKEVAHLKAHLSLKISELIYNGFWFSPEMEFLMAAISQSQKFVSGIVNLTLYKGNVIITGRSSDKSLYDEAIASMNEFGGYDQQDAKGFIRLHAQRLMLHQKRSQS
jgi:argininosuccinate synthase